MNVATQEMEDVVGFSSNGESRGAVHRLAPGLKQREALLALRFDGAFDFDNLKAHRIDPDTPDKVTLAHVVRIGLDRWPDIYSHDFL